MKRLISLEIEEEMLQKLKDLAVKQDRSLSSLVRIIMAEYIKNNERQMENGPPNP